MSQSRVLPHLTCSHTELALTGNRAGQHLTALLLLGWCRLARDHALVDIGSVSCHKALCADHLAVDRHLLAGTHFEDIAFLNRRDRHFPHLSILNNVGSLRGHTHELTDAGGSTVLCLLLKQSASEHKGDDHDRSIEIGVPLDALTAPRLLAPKGVEDREEEGDDSGEAHQRIHVGSGMKQLAPCRTVEGPTADDNVGKSQEQLHLIGQ